MSDKTKEFVQNDNSPEAKLRRYLERKRREREEFERNRPHPKSRDELQDIIIAAIEKNGPEANLNHIDVSEIDDMSSLFSLHYSDDDDKGKILRSFNGDISDWDVSNVKNMSKMFCYATSFNGDISDWDVSNVENMNSMFYGAKSFYGDISQWYVRKVKNMSFMFHDASSFNQNLSRWDVTGKDTEDMFEYCPIKDEFKPKGL